MIYRALLGAGAWNICAAGILISDRSYWLAVPMLASGSWLLAVAAVGRITKVL